MLSHGKLQGVRKEENMANVSYFSRCLILLRAEAKVFTLGLVTLLLSNACNLAIPKVQGSALNSVVNSRGYEFYFWVKTYLIIAILSGLLGGIEGLCFRVVGKYMLRKLQNVTLLMSNYLRKKDC